MERVLVICIAAFLGIFFYYGVARVLKRELICEVIHRYSWLMYPNSICYWRAGMAILALLLYFYFGQQSVAIFVFTFAAILDGVDGMVARRCQLISRLGEWLDPLCDKLTYLPPLLGFAYVGILSEKLVWALIVVELFGQFFARKVLRMLNISGAANNFGKIKAILCFALVIFCALLQQVHSVVNLGDELLLACVIMATASVVFKFIPNWLYADILSTLNFICGVLGLYFTHQGFFVRAIIVIMIGQLFDLFDGRMAMKHGGTPLGPYLDDIADFVSFGLAPAYVMMQAGSRFAPWVSLAFICGVAFRLVRFVVIDKKRTDLPEGIFSGLPSPAGALIVLGAAISVPSAYLWIVACISILLMVSTFRFAHLGRVVLKKMPRPIFFSISAAIILLFSYVCKTKSAHLFGILILVSVILYMVVGRIFLDKLQEEDSAHVA